MSDVTNPDPQPQDPQPEPRPDQPVPDTDPSTDGGHRAHEPNVPFEPEGNPE